MTDLAQALVVIYISRDDGLTWQPVLPADVPDWLKQPDEMAMLLAGNMAKNKGAIEVDADKLPWYRAERIDAPTLETKQ